MSSTHAPNARLAALTLGAVGVVYGDIGTSPLYAFRESIAAAMEQGGIITPQSVLGITSLVVWALMLIVTLKYVVLVLRADNHGEGGILSLMTLALGGARQAGRPWLSPSLLLLGMLGAALFYGDAVITPAISVLSAIEGLELVTHAFTPFIIPISVTIIIALFLMQAHGTERIARYFGPAMVVWFFTMA
ncbi:MAG: KUP/HAK/KT family potassium transporter, partial [Rickettsiales bacterium]|nr:KUP/HAK/KT family potassium transporter [Rickettsiales bacterium]